MEKTDHELWLRVRSDDGGAFEALFERYANDVYNFCFRRTASWSRAEDLVSEVFLEAWRRRRDVHLTNSAFTLRPWLLAVALNKTRNESRRWFGLRRALSRLGEPSEPDFAESALDRLQDEQRMHELNEAVTQLPKGEADALVLYAWAQLQYREIADVLGIPIGTVRSRLARARRRIHELDSRSRHEQHDMSHAEDEAESEGSHAFAKAPRAKTPI